MTLPGGAAAKIGNRYETWWTLSEFVRMLRGDTEAIRLEVPGIDKAEFVVTTGARRELHQAKRSHPSGKWSLATLRADGLLQAIGRQLADNTERFVFASGSDARELSDLCDAARHAESEDEFERDFLAAKDRKANFEKLLNCWACDLPTTVERLRRIEVHSIDERELERTVRWGVQALFVADPKRVLSELREIVDNSVHCTITHQGLVGELSRRGFLRRRVTSPASAGVTIHTATARFLDGARRRLIQQQLVPRAAAGALLSRLGETTTDSVMTGRAGSGKTACVVEVVDGLREQGVPVMAFRLDRLVSASSTAELGQRLDLEESPVLVLAAAAEAAGRPGVLIVDQLDAVSTMSGRTSGAFEIVERLLQEARGMRARVTIHTVVVCRAFDWKHDSRLRQLMPDSHAQVDVTEFTVDEVKTILPRAGFDSALFRPRQLEILQLPQNLSLFLEAGFDASRAPTFRTSTEIFDRYWDAKQRVVSDRVAPAAERWMEVMETLCDEMTSTQQLTVRRERLDGISTTYVDQLASEGVITFDGHRYGFGHESFFDYVFARVFVNRSKPMVAFLKASEQHLFRRTQVRQVLAYLRDADPARYVAELRDLLSDDEIRPHLKDLAFALLATITDPTDDEWTIWTTWIAPALRAIEDDTPNPDTLSALAWRRFFGSRSWFADIDRRGMIEDWLTAGNDRLADMAVNYLWAHQRHSPDRVAALLEPYADRGGAWARRLRSLVERAGHHTSRRFFALFLRLVDNGTLDEARGPIAENSTFWRVLHNFGEIRPEWVPEVLAHRLRRRLTVIRAAGEDLGERELLGCDYSAVEMIAKSAERAPAVFVEHVLPIVLEISDSALTGDKPPKHDAVWSILVKTEHPDGEDACLSRLASALAALAREHSLDVRGVITDLRRRDTHIANHLLLALYRGGAAHYGDEAITLLSDEPWRFQCGFADSPHWCAMEVIRAIVPHCTTDNRERIEAVILGYAPPYERTQDGYRLFGRAQLDLLSAFPAELRSPSANTRFHELVRKFGEPDNEPREITADFVEPPIEKTATDRMTDDQWLRAIDKYRSKHPTMYSADDALKGGARELAQTLAERVKEKPDRFARLSLRFPADANPVYLTHTLNALRTTAVASDLKLQVCRKAFAESPGPCGQSITDVLGSIEDPLPDKAVHMLHWLATEHEDPATETWQADAGGGQPYYNGDILTAGINTTRGRAANGIQDLILNDAAYIDRFRPTLDRMIQDPSAAVRSCVAGTIRAIASHAPALGMSLFLNMNLSEDRLLATRHAYAFIRGSLRDGFAELRPIVEAMLRSSEPGVCEAGARLASIAALHHESASDLADEGLRGGVHQRLGVATVASANIAAPECRAWSEARLVVLFDDDDASVRREAASCFRRVSDDSLETYGGLIEAFGNSRAFAEGSFSLFRALEHSRTRLPGMTCRVCETFLDRFAGEARDAPLGRFGDTHTVAKLIFRTYQQHQHDEWTARSLDLIDRVCLEGILGAEDEFEQFER